MRTTGNDNCNSRRVTWRVVVLIYPAGENQFFHPWNSLIKKKVVAHKSTLFFLVDFRPFWSPLIISLATSFTRVCRVLWDEITRPWEWERTAWCRHQWQQQQNCWKKEPLPVSQEKWERERERESWNFEKLAVIFINPDVPPPCNFCCRREQKIRFLPLFSLSRFARLGLCPPFPASSQGWNFDEAIRNLLERFSNWQNQKVRRGRDRCDKQQRQQQQQQQQKNYKSCLEFLLRFGGGGWERGEKLGTV